MTTLWVSNFSHFTLSFNSCFEFIHIGFYLIKHNLMKQNQGYLLIYCKCKSISVLLWRAIVLVSSREAESNSDLKWRRKCFHLETKSQILQWWRNCYLQTQSKQAQGNDIYHIGSGRLWSSGWFSACSL